MTPIRSRWLIKAARSSFENSKRTRVFVPAVGAGTAAAATSIDRAGARRTRSFGPQAPQGVAQETSHGLVISPRCALAHSSARNFREMRESMPSQGSGSSSARARSDSPSTSQPAPAIASRHRSQRIRSSHASSRAPARYAASTRSPARSSPRDTMPSSTEVKGAW